MNLLPLMYSLTAIAYRLTSLNSGKMFGCDISILWPIIDPILVTFVQICNFRDHSLVSFYFYELIHSLHRMKNISLFICGTNILVRLLTVNMKNCNTPPKIGKCATPL